MCNPTEVMVRGLPAAISRSIWQRTPCGQFLRPFQYSPSTASLPSLGARAQWPPIPLPHHPLVAQMIQAAGLAIALASARHQGQVARMTLLQKALLQGTGQRLRMDRTDEAPAHDTISVLNQVRRLAGRITLDFI